MNETITADEVRGALLAKVDAYVATSGRSDSFVGREAVNDDKFITRVREGANFTVKTYQRVIDWLDGAAKANAA